SSITAFKCESGLALTRFSSVCAPPSTFDKSPVVSDLLPKDSVIGSTWTFDHITNKETSSNCSTSALKQEPVSTQVGTPLVSAPVFCPPAPFIASTRSNIAESYPPSGAIELVPHTTLSSPAPAPGTFTSPQPSLSFLLTADSNRSKVLPNCVSTDQSGNHTLNYLNLPLQVLQALPNLRPGMSILLNVKNNRANGQVNAVTSTPPGTQPFSGIAAKRTDGPVFLLPNSQIPVCVTSKMQPSQIIPAQHSCQLNPNLNQTVLFMPSMPSSSVNSTVLSGGLNSIASTNANGTLNGASSVFPSGTQFLLLRSPSKPDSKQNDLTQVPNINPTPDTSFLISGNLAQKTQLKSSLLLIPTAVPPAAQHSCMFPNLTSQFNFQTAASNLLDVNTLPSWGLRPPDAQSILGLNPNSNCLQLGLGTPNATVQNALLAAALSRSISNSVAASTLSLPIAVLPTNPQTLLMPPATSVLKPSSSSIPVLPGPLASFLSTNTTQTTPVITTGSFSSVNFDPNVKLSMTTQPGHSSASVSNIPASSTAPSISYVPVSTSDLQSLSHSSVFPPKKLVVLPSADNLLCSSSRPSFSSDCTSLVSTPCPLSSKQTESKFPLLSSFVSQSLSPCVLPSPTVTLSSTKSTSPAPQSNTPGHVTCRRRHQCPYCPKSCERKDNLQAHIRTHTGERPYPCRFCPKAFPQKDHLRAHIRTHTGEKPYRCPQCMKAFAQLGNLHRHVKTHKR
ncbi:Transcription factor che-1, partial [Fasciolopsis buskii]